MKTKLEKILLDKGMSQGDLIRKIQDNTGFRIGRDRISKIATGRLKNFTLMTAVMIAEALDIKVDDFIELKNVKKS